MNCMNYRRLLLALKAIGSAVRNGKDYMSHVVSQEKESKEASLSL